MSTCEEEERVRGLSLTSICMVQNTGVRLQQAVQPDHHLQQLLKNNCNPLSNTLTQQQKQHSLEQVKDHRRNQVAKKQKQLTCCTCKNTSARTRTLHPPSLPAP